MQSTGQIIYYSTAQKKCNQLKHTFSEFEKEPRVYCSKEAVAISHCFTNLDEERNMVKAEKGSEGCADNTGSASFNLFSSFPNTPLTPVAREGYSCILRCTGRPVNY